MPRSLMDGGNGRPDCPACRGAGQISLGPHPLGYAIARYRRCHVCDPDHSPNHLVDMHCGCDMCTDAIRALLAADQGRDA